MTPKRRFEKLTIDRMLPQILQLQEEIGPMFDGLAVLMCRGYILVLEPKGRATI